jgi:hypothetical protein
MKLLDHPLGNYRFLTGIAPYAAGVIAQPGFLIQRVQLDTPLPFAAGFARIAEYLQAIGRPHQALCAMELRIPAPLSFAGFAELNGGYRSILAEWGILVGDYNPVARTNVAPAAAAPTEPVIYAFSLTLPDPARTCGTTLIVAGAGDLRDQAELTPEAIVARGDTSVAALQTKARTVMQVMAERLHGLGADWPQVTDINLYTVHSPDLFLEPVLLPQIGSAARGGVHWHYSRPPIQELEYEMDLRRAGITVQLG